MSMRLIGKLLSPNDQKPPEKPWSVVVSESLMMELDYHLREVEREKREREQLLAEQRRVKSVDYSWLATKRPTKLYEMSQVERLELQQLCEKVKPNECSLIISMFRESLLHKPPIAEIPRAFRACIVYALERRPKEETMPEWVMRSMTKLRTNKKVAPANCMEEDRNSVELSSSSSTTPLAQDSATTSSGAISNETERRLSQQTFHNLDMFMV